MSGSGVSVKERNIAARKESFKVHLQQQSHYFQVTDNLNKMSALMDELSNADPSDHSVIKDRFSMAASLVDKHWKICDRLLPKEIKDDDSNPYPDILFRLSVT